MRLREFILRLSLCHCLSRRMKYRILMAAVQQKQISNVSRLTDHLNMTFTKRMQWLDEWASQGLYHLTEQNLQMPFITPLDAVYPRQLREIYDPPLVLYYQGDLRLLQYPSLAVVGARNISKYGERAINQLLPGISSSQAAIVSGLAKGVDGLAHQITLLDGGAAIGVIGTGLNGSYPRCNASLQQQVAQHGLLLTEYPLGTPPCSVNFPERNRIIAGLCHACLVIEASRRSGSLITANLALQDNRNVCAVPGPIDSPMSIGTNELIAAGAKPILSSQDVLEEIPDWTFLSN